MKKNRLIFLVLLITQLFTFAYPQGAVRKAKQEATDKCEDVIRPFSCDIVTFACPLNVAIAAGSFPCVKQMAESNDYGVTTYIPTRRYPAQVIPIINAVMSGYPDIVGLLLKYNSDTEVRDAKFGLTPLLWATNLIFSPPVDDTNNLQIIEILLKSGADIDAKDKYGNTPLIANAGWGRYEYIKLLMAYSANLNLQNEKGETVLMRAVDDKRILTPLVRSNVLIRDNEGRTAMFYAIEKCQPNKFRLLINKNPDLLKIRDSDGTSPIEFANSADIRTKCPEISKQLTMTLAARRTGFDDR